MKKVGAKEILYKRIYLLTLFDAFGFVDKRENQMMTNMSVLQTGSKGGLFILY